MLGAHKDRHCGGDTGKQVASKGQQSRRKGSFFVSKVLEE